MRRNGFTLAELVVASTVTAICLAGVYGVLARSLAMESRQAAEHQGRQTAKAIADGMAYAIEHSVQIRGGIAGGQEKDRPTCFLSCYVSGLRGDSLPQAGAMHRRYYRWNFPAESGLGGKVELRTILQAGDEALLPPVGGEVDVEGDEPAWWDAIVPVIVGEGATSVSVQYRDASEAEVNWSDSPPKTQWMVARVSVTVGGQTVERVVSPGANAELVQQ